MSHPRLKKFALHMLGGTLLGIALGAVIHFKMQAQDFSAPRAGKAASGALDLWASMAMGVGLCLVSVLVLTACDLWFARKKKLTEETSGGLLWMTPLCRTVADSPDFCFEALPNPVELPTACRLEVRCAARHKTPNSHYVVLHVRTLPGFRWDALLAQRDAAKKALQQAAGGNLVNSQVVWWLIEGGDTAQAGPLGSWVDDLGRQAVIFLWAAGIDPASKQAFLLCNPMTSEKTARGIHALHQRLSTEGYAVEFQAKERHAAFQVLEKIHAISPSALLHRALSRFFPG